MAKAGPLSLRLFLEGIEVPIISAQINISPSKPATASIQIVPTDTALAFKPRTLVHLFFLEGLEAAQDKGLGDPAFEYLKQLEEHPQRPSDSTFVVDDEQYKLLYIGEIVGLTYAKTSGTRSIILQCMDLSSYWDNCFQWFADYSVHGSAFTDKAHIFVGAGEGLFDNITGGHTWVISRILQSAPQTPGYESTRGLQGGMISLLETVGGLRPGHRGSSVSPEGLAGVNDFFSVAEMRYGLTAMLGAVREDKTSVQIYAAKAFRAWLKNGMASIGNLVSYRNLVQQVGRWVFHDIYPNPAAYYYSGGVYKANVTRSFVQDKKLRVLLKEARKAAMDLNRRIAEGEGHIKRGEVDLASHSGDLALNARSSLVEELRKAIAYATSGVAVPKKVTAKLRELESVVEGESNKIEVSELERQLRSIIKGKVIEVERKSGEHLFNQLLLPETFFVPPPKCNVIFPDVYTQFNYSRNFLREVTRLSVQGGLGVIGTGGLAKLLGHHYFAPNLKDVRGNSLHNTLRFGARVLLPHEVHSGIIPKFEWVPQGHRWAARAATNTSSNKSIEKSKAIPYVQRMSNFQYFVHRWASRTMSVNMKFNPYLVIGFPGVVFDRAAPAPAARAVVESILERDVSPVQYVGKLVSVTHSVSQQGGFTAANMTQCRTHRGIDDEFLGVMDVGSNEWFRTIGSSKKISIDVAKFIAPGRMKPISHEMRRIGSAPQPIEKPFSSAGVKTKYPREKARKLLSALAGGLTRIRGDKTYMTRQELKNRGWTARNIRDDARPIGKKESRLSGRVWDNQYYEIPTDAVDPAEHDFNFEVKESFKGTLVPGVGVIKSVKISLGKIKINPSDLAKMGLVQPSEPTSEITKSIAVPAADGTTTIWFPSSVTFEYVYDKSLGTKGLPPKLAFERALMPGWYSEAWSPEKISENVYKWLLGTNAITDDVSLGTGMRDVLLNEGMGPPRPDEPDLGDIRGSLADLEDDVKVLTVEQAIDALGIYYMLLQEARANLHDFIRTYTSRPIASLTQIMGSADFEVDAAGNAIRGTEGFHSRAFGDYNVGAVLKEGKEPKAGPKAFQGLLGPGGFPKQRRISMGTGKQNAGVIPAAFDPRGPSRQRVRAYASELRVSRGLKGS